MADVVRQAGARLKGQVQPLLQARFYPGSIDNLRRSYLAFHSFDKAHTIALAEAGLITHEVASAILSGLREMEVEGLEKARDALGGGRHSGEAYLNSKIGPDKAGWINMGRSSGDLDAVSWRFNLRQRIPAFLEKLLKLRQSLVSVAEENVDTVMPCYSIGQAAQCTSFAHMMLSWEAMFMRDSKRLSDFFDEISASPSGSAIMTGSTFPISRKRTAELLGFDSVILNTRDATVNLDSLLHAHSIVSICISNALSVANDMYLWTMPEYRFLDLDDSWCSTSSIMPQKKNSWALAWIRGQASLAIGRLGGVFTLLKMESDGLEDTLLGPWQLYDAMDEAEDMLSMLEGMIGTMTVNKDRLAETASHGWTQATDLAALLTMEAGLPWRDAHQVVAHLVRESVDAGIDPSEICPDHINEVAGRLLGKTLQLNAESVRKALDPRASLRNREVVEGSPAPSRLKEQFQILRGQVERDRARMAALARGRREMEEKLEAAVQAVIDGKIK